MRDTLPDGTLAIDGKDFVIAIDFDGTLVYHRYPRIGDWVPYAKAWLREFHNRGIKIVLYTMRSGERLREAIDFLKENDVKLYGINVNPTQAEWTESPKAYANLYIDDAGASTPVAVDDEGKEYVLWNEVGAQVLFRYNLHQARRKRRHERRRKS